MREFVGIPDRAQRGCEMGSRFPISDPSHEVRRVFPAFVHYAYNVHIGQCSLSLILCEEQMTVVTIQKHCCMPFDIHYIIKIHHTICTYYTHLVSCHTPFLVKRNIRNQLLITCATLILPVSMDIYIISLQPNKDWLNGSVHRI